MNTMDDNAKENWARYCYGKDRGHVEYMEQAQKCEGMYLGGGSQWSEADKAVLPLPRQAGFMVRCMTGKLFSSGVDDHPGQQVERAPFHRAAENDRAVFCFQGNSRAHLFLL